MADFGGKDNQDIKINIDVTGASEAASKLESLADSIEMMSPEAYAGDVAAAQKAAEEERRIAAETAAARKAAKISAEEEAARVTARLDQEREERRAAYEIARAGVIKRQQDQEALAASVAAAAIQDRLKAMEGLEGASERVKAVEEENLRLVNSRREALDTLLERQESITKEIAAAAAKRDEADRRAEALAEILQRQRETELKPYTGELITPEAIAKAERQLAELQEKANKLSEPIKAARAQIESAPRRTETDLSGPGGKVKRTEQVRLPSPDGRYSAEDEAARESFLRSIKEVLGGKPGKFDTSDPAKLFAQLEELIKKANAVGPGNFSGIQQSEDIASDSNFKVIQLSAALKELQDKQAEVLDRVVSGPPKGAAPKSAEAKEFADVVARAGSISKEITALESALAAERSRGDQARSITKGAKEAFNAKSLGVTADQMPKLIELFTKIRQNLALRDQITATSPTVWMDESEARKRIPSTKELDDVVKRAADLERELSRARGQYGDYKAPTSRGETSGPRLADKEGRTDAQLEKAIAAAKEESATSSQFQAGFMDTKAQIDKAVAEAEAAVIVAFRESRKRMADAIGPMVDSIDLDAVFSDLLKDIADRMVEKFRKSGKKTEEEVDRFRQEILATGESPLSAKSSFTKSGTQRRGAPVIREMPGDAPFVAPVAPGAARVLLNQIAGELLKASPLLRGVATAKADRDRDREVEERQQQLRLRASEARPIPKQLTNIGSISQPSDVQRDLVRDLEAEFTVLDGIEQKTEAQILRFKAVRDQLDEIKNTAVRMAGSGEILGILSALGLGTDTRLGTRERGVAGIESPFTGSVVSSLFKPTAPYQREGQEPILDGLGNPVEAMLTRKREKTGSRGIELQTVAAEGEDLTEFYETVEKTAVGITAIFAKIVDNMRGGKANDPALLTNLKEQIVGLMAIMRAVQDMDIDASLPAGQQEKFRALKETVAQLAGSDGGVIGAISALAQGALTDSSMSSILGKTPDERQSIAGELAQYVLTPLLPNLEALTAATKALVGSPSSKQPGSGQAEIAGVPFGQPGALGDMETIKGIVATIASGDAEKIREVIAEAIARNVLDADQLRSMIPGETGVGVKPRNEEIKNLSAEEGKFDLGSAGSRLKFADIIKNIPSIMDILGNYPTLAALVAKDPELLDALAAEEERAKAEFAELARRIASFKKVVPKLVPSATLKSLAGEIFSYSGAPDQGTPSLRPVTDASSLSEEEARTITPSSIPPNLVREYKGAGRDLGRGVYGRTASGFVGAPAEVELTPDQARKVAQDVIDFLKSKGLSVATLEVAQEPGFAPLEDVAKGATGRIPEKTIITVIHRGDTVLDDPAVATGLTEALKSLKTIPTVNRGVTIASYPSTDVRIPGEDPRKPTPPGYSGITAGVNRGGGVVETFAMIQLAEQMRLRPSGPLVPVPGAGAVASHETKHMAVIGGNKDSVFQDPDVMLPVHRAIFTMVQRMAKELANPSGNVTDELRQRMEEVVRDFFENLPPAAVQDAMITGSEAKLNMYVSEFLANAMAQMEGYKSGAGRSISHGGTGEFSGSTLEFLKQMFGPRKPPAGGNYGFSGSPSEDPAFIEETLGNLFDTYQKEGGFTRRVVRSEGGFKIAAEEPESGYTVGGAQLANPESGLLNFRKSDVLSSTGSLGEALNILFEENRGKFEEMMLKGAAVWIGVFTQDVKDTSGKIIEGTAFDITEVIKDQAEAEALAKKLGQDSYGSYEKGKFVWKDEFKLREQGEEQPLTMDKNQDGSFSRIPGTLSGELGPVTTYDYRTKSRKEAARTRREEKREVFNNELGAVLEGQTSFIDGPSGGLAVTNFDAFKCEQCGKLTSERDGGVIPNQTNAFCADCWKKVSPFFNKNGPNDGYKYKPYGSKTMPGSEFRGMVNRKTEGLDEEGLAELDQSEEEAHIGRYNRGEEGDYFGEMASQEEILFADEITAKDIADSRAAFERKKAARKKAKESEPIEGTATTVSETPGERIYGFGAGPDDPASLDFDFSDLLGEEDDAVQLGKIKSEGGPVQLGKIKSEGGVIPLETESADLDFDFSDLEDDGSIQEDSSDTYAPVEEEKPKPKKEKKPRKKKTPLGADPRSTLVTPREAEIAQAEELGVSTEELAIITPEQTERLIKKKQAKDMAANAARDEERLKTAGSRAVAARKKAREMDPRARLETPLEAQIDEGAEVGLSPDEAVRVDPSVIERKKKRALEDKIAELNAADAARRAKVEQERFAREKTEREAAEAKEKEASDKKIAAEAARAKVAEEEAKAAEAAAPKAAEAPKVAAEPTKEEYDAQNAEDLKAKKERMAAQRRARAAAKKAAVAAEQEAVAIESSAVESDRVAAVERATVAESQQEVPAQAATPTKPATPAGPPAPPSRPPAPPTPPAGGGDQPGGSSPLDAIVNQAIAAMGLGTSLPTLQALIDKLNETVNTMVSGRVSDLAAAGIEADPAATRQQILDSNLGGFGKLLSFLENLASFAKTIRSQGEVPTVDVSGKPMRAADASQAFGNATNLPEGLSRANMMKIAEEFDTLGTEVAVFIQMARNGTLKIKQEVQSAAATPPGGSTPPPSGGSSGGRSPQEDSGYTAPDLVNIYKGQRALRDLSNIYRELRPQVAHLSGDIDAQSTSLQKQQRAARDTADAMGAYMNVNTGVLRSLKTQVGRAATFLFVQQIGREISTVVEHLQSGVFNFNQVLENTKVGFNTLFANTLQASSSARNELVPAYNEVGAQVGFVREQALSFKEALALTSNAADNMVARIRDIANVTPFRFQPLVEASLKMKAFGFAATEIPDMINAISNAVAALGGNDEKIDRISYALGQMNSAGRVYQNDMMQLANAGIAGYRMLSEKMLTDLISLKKYTMGELKDLPDYVIKEMERLQSAIGSANFTKSFGSMDQMIETLQDPRRAEGLIRNMAKRGFLLGSVAARAITEGMDKQYQGSADRLSKTMTGALSTIADLSQNFMATAFEPLFKSVRDTIVELGAFMLSSKEITTFVNGVRDNVKQFVDSLREFGPVLQNIASIFVNVFIGGIGSALEKGSQFGAMFSMIIEKVSAGFSLIGEILNDKVGRGLAAAATLGTMLFKAITANPMIASIGLIVIAISGIADAIRTNFMGIGTILAIFMDAIKGLVTVVTDAMATIAQDLGTGALQGFIAGLTGAIVALTPFLMVLLGTFSVLLKILTPFSGILGVLLGLFIAFKVATMAWNLATLAIGKPIAAIAGAWTGAATAVKSYQDQIKLTAQMHQDLQQKKIAAGDFIKGTDGKALKDKDGQPILNYDRATEIVSSQGYPSQEAGNRATSVVNAGTRVGNFLERVDEKMPAPLKGLLTNPRERIFGVVKPDYGPGFTMQHNDPANGGHMSTVITNEKIENRFDALKPGGSLAAIGQQMSAAGLINIPGFNKGALEASANQYATAYGDNLKTLILIEKEVSYVLSEAFRKMEAMASEYKAAVESKKPEDVARAAEILGATRNSEEAKIILPMLMEAKGDKRDINSLSDEEVGELLLSWKNGGTNLSEKQARNVTNLPKDVEARAVGAAAKRIASGDSKLTGGEDGEEAQLKAATDAGRAKTAAKGGSIGAFNKMGLVIEKFFNTINNGTARLVKNIPLLEKLQKINLGGQGTGLQQIQKIEGGKYAYVNEDGSIGPTLSSKELNSRRSMRGGLGKGGKLGSFFGRAGAMAGLASGASRAAGFANAGLAMVDAIGMGDAIPTGLRQTLSAKSGLFQSLGNSVGTMLGTGLGSMVPIVGPIIGPIIGSVFGEIAGSIIDGATRASEAAIAEKKRIVASYVALGLSPEVAEKAAAAESKYRDALGYTGENAGGIPFFVDTGPETDSTPEERALYESKKQQLNSKEILDSYDENKNGVIDSGKEMYNAINALNLSIEAKIGGVYSGIGMSSVFQKNDDGSYINNTTKDQAKRNQLIQAGYTPDSDAYFNAGVSLSDEDIAAVTAATKAKSLINAASISEQEFLQMAPGAQLNASELHDFKTTKVTGVQDQTPEGDMMRALLSKVGLSADQAVKDPMIGRLLQNGSDFGTIVATLKQNKEGGATLSVAAQKLVDYADLLEIKSSDSFTDEYGNVRKSYQSGFSQLLAYDAAQIDATSGKDKEGKVIAGQEGVGFAKLFGAHAVAQGAGIGGSDMMYSDMFMEGLKAMGRIDPMDAMIEAGVIQSVGDMVGKSSQEIADMWKKTTEYFDAFKRRAEALEPKVDIKASRLDLMEEFGRDIGYRLFDQFTKQREQLVAKEKEFKKLGGDGEVERLQRLANLGNQTYQEAKVVKSTSTSGTVSGNGEGLAPTTSDTITYNTVKMPDLLTAAERGRLEKLKALTQEMEDLRFQRFDIEFTYDARKSDDPKIKAQALKDEAALARFRQDNKDALAAIAELKAKGGLLTQAQIALDQRETTLRDKLVITETEKVALGETLAALEKQGITISNAELLGNKALLQIIGMKAKLQQASIAAGKTLVYYKGIESDMETAMAAKSGIQLDIDEKRWVLQQKMATLALTPASAEALYSKFESDNKVALDKLKMYDDIIARKQKELDTNPWEFSKAERDEINAILKRATGAMVDAPASDANATAVQRNSNLLNTMANVAQKAYERVRSAQKRTHDEYVKQLDDQAKAIDERYKKRGDEQQEQSLLQQLQLSGLAMRSEGADPLEAAKAFYEAKNNLAEFYITKQKDDELKAIEDEKTRYDKQFQDNSDAQEAIYAAAMERMKNRFSAVDKVMTNNDMTSEQLNDLLRLTMTGTLPNLASGIAGASESTLFQSILGSAKQSTAEGKQQLALDASMGTLEIGQYAAEGGQYKVDADLLDGILVKLTSSVGGLLDASNVGLRVFRGTTEESGLLATFMNEKIASSLTFKDGSTTKTGAANIKEYLDSIRPSKGFVKGAQAGYEEQGREKDAIYEYVTSLMSAKNTFSTETKTAVLAQRTLEQALSDFEKATNVDINFAGLLETDTTDKIIETFMKSIGEVPTAEKMKELKTLIRDTYADVLAGLDAAEYAKFANSSDVRVGNLTANISTIDDAMKHLSDTLNGGMTTLDKILFGDKYQADKPLSGFDAATEQIDVITAAIADMQTAFEGTMTNLEAYADSLQGPIGAFHQLAEAMSLVGESIPNATFGMGMTLDEMTGLGQNLGASMGLAASVQTSGIGGARTSVTTYNQVPVNITINGAQDMNTADLAAKVEEAVGRAIRGSGGSYITSPTGSLTS
jgi:tape measure domain-containing protein